MDIPSMNIQSMEPEQVKAVCKQLAADMRVESGLTALSCFQERGAVEEFYSELIGDLRKLDDSVRHLRSFYPREEDVYLPQWLEKDEIGIERQRLINDAWSIDAAHNIYNQRHEERKDFLARYNRDKRIDISKNLRNAEIGLAKRLEHFQDWQKQQLQLAEVRFEEHRHLTHAESAHKWVMHMMKVHTYNLENNMPPLSMETPYETLNDEIKRRKAQLKRIAQTVNSMDDEVKRDNMTWTHAQREEYRIRHAKLEDLCKGQWQAISRLEDQLPRIAAIEQEENEWREERDRQKARERQDRGRSSSARRSEVGSRAHSAGSQMSIEEEERLSSVNRSTPERSQAGSPISLVRFKSERMSTAERASSRGSRAGSRPGSKDPSVRIKSESMSLVTTPVGGPTWPPRYESSSEERQGRSR